MTKYAIFAGLGGGFGEPSIKVSMSSLPPQRQIVTHMISPGMNTNHMRAPTAF